MRPPKIDQHFVVLRKAVRAVEQKVEEIDERIGIRMFLQMSTDAKPSKIGKCHFYTKKRQFFCLFFPLSIFFSLSVSVNSCQNDHFSSTC